MRTTLLLSILPLLALPLPGASQAWVTSADDGCRRMGRDGEGWCEVREATFPAGAAVDVDGGDNGGVTVHGWDRDEVRVEATVFAHHRGGSAAARALASEVTLRGEGERFSAAGPRGRDGGSWGVSWEVWAPRGARVDAKAINGGVALDGLGGVVRFQTQNGGVHLEDMAGDVRGETRNGGLHVALAGSGWEGAGLDVETMNGGVTLSVPEGYSARLETGTVNGGLTLDFPVTVSGRVDRRIATTLGSGGATVRVETRNGSVRLRRR